MPPQPTAKLTRCLVAGIAALALLLSSIACNVPALQFGAPPAPSLTTPDSTDALASFRNKWRDLTLATPGGPFTLSFTEAELTAAVNAAVADREASTGADIPFDNLQVRLADSAASVYGTARIEPLEFNGVITAVPSIDPSGRIAIAITQVSFGPLEFDSVVLDEIVAAVEQSINAPLISAPLNITLTSISIADAQLTVTGDIAP
jgi:hypothetical protein